MRAEKSTIVHNRSIFGIVQNNPAQHALTWKPVFELVSPLYFNPYLMTKTERSKTDHPLSPAITPAFPIEKAKAILNQYGISYTDEEIAIIRDFITRLTEITLAFHERAKAKRVIPITQINDHESAKSLSLHPCQHRRAG